MDCFPYISPEILLGVEFTHSKLSSLIMIAFHITHYLSIFVSNH